MQQYGMKVLVVDLMLKFHRQAEKALEMHDIEMAMQYGQTIAILYRSLDYNIQGVEDLVDPKLKEILEKYREK